MILGGAPGKWISHSDHAISAPYFMVALFAAAMGLLETIVVIYLRQVYYPLGFGFPLASFPEKMLGIELLRELATLVMLFAVAFLAGRSAYARLAWFLYAFAVWDIVYYLGLKWLTGWPESLLTWDILFLIPVTWVGPVLAPVLCSLTMIVMAVLVVRNEKNQVHPVMTPVEWMLVAGGATMIFISFIWDYTALLIRGGYMGKLATLTGDPEFREVITTYIPTWFNWYLFGAGEGLILLALGLMAGRKQYRADVCS